MKGKSMADDEEYAAALNKLFKGSLELRETNYVCGFCGRKYDADLAPTYCDSDDCPAYEARRLWSQYNVSKQCEPERWCMCEGVDTVARDLWSTCGKCGGKDAYKNSQDRPAWTIADIQKPMVCWVNAQLALHRGDSDLGSCVTAIHGIVGINAVQVADTGLFMLMEPVLVLRCTMYGGTATNVSIRDDFVAGVTVLSPLMNGPAAQLASVLAGKLERLQLLANIIDGANAVGFRTSSWNSDAISIQTKNGPAQMLSRDGDGGYYLYTHSAARYLAPRRFAGGRSLYEWIRSEHFKKCAQYFSEKDTLE